MATGAFDGSQAAARRRAGAATDDVATKTLAVLASLKVTVVLLALATFVVLAGTLAQVNRDMWDVMAEYFDAWVAIIRVKVFFPITFFPYDSIQDNALLNKLAFPFPGGKAIGCAMMVNLIAAHFVRFQVQAKAKKLQLGLGVIAAGVLLTTLVIISGHSRGGLQGKPPLETSTMWELLRLSMIACTAGCAYGLVSLDKTRRSERILLWCGAALFGFIVVLLYWPTGNFMLGDAGMRILWQLMQGTFAGGVTLAGCFLVFGRRGGVVLLHAGIGLLMAGQLFVSLFAVEERMTIREGDTVNWVQDIRAVELAFIDTSESGDDHVVAVPLTEKGQITRFNNEKKVVSASETGLPFDLQVVKFYKNSSNLMKLDQAKRMWDQAQEESRKKLAEAAGGSDKLLPPKEEFKNFATAGIGMTYAVGEAEPSSGASSEGRVDVAAAYVKVLEKGTDREIGTYLFSQVLDQQHFLEKITVDGKTYEGTLRFKRTYKPYSMTLNDVKKEDYPGTTIPKNYQSDVQLVDASRRFDDSLHIRMNEPLRYAGETFYQSGYHMGEDGVEVTDLQVVTNTGWMVPYVACMLVVIGMLAHFFQTLLRFIGRVIEPTTIASSSASSPDVVADLADSSTSSAAAQIAAAGGHAAAHKRSSKSKRRDGDETPAGGDLARATGDAPASTLVKMLAVPVTVACVFALFFAGRMRTPAPSADGFDLYAFGQLPVLEKGRVKPLDSLARNALRAISNKETYKDKDGKTQPAIRWFLDVVTDRPDDFKDLAHSQPIARSLAVFRIENSEVLQLFGLERREGFRYSVKELMNKIGDFEKQTEEAQKLARESASKLSTFQRKLVELDGRIRTFTLMKAAFEPLDLPPVPTEAEFNANPQAAQQKIMRLREAMMQIPEMDRQLARMQPPRLVPSKSADDDWQAYSTAWNREYVRQILQLKDGGKPDKATEMLSRIFGAYAQNKPTEFNNGVAEYRAWLQADRPELYQPYKVSLESWFNNFAPFFWSEWCYVLAFIITAVAWMTWILGWNKGLNRFGFWVVCCTLVVHTVALALRVVISGRPPVTNLYSSAIFIGWACAVFGVAIEWLFKLGVGNALASVTGFATLLIADRLALDGDTMVVMQAVLDTQFWLATHVVCITLGYSATFAAGALGLIYVGCRMFTSALDEPVAEYRGAPVTLGKALGTMTYGVTCFAIFFSFWGTVLGGLWADDSWGRFWGWDPKENGALMIVLWNALVLHARWDKMIGDRGLAILSIVGNIVTSWSWFGVNELGVGLHSYGFTEGVFRNLVIFWTSQMFLVGIGCLPGAWMPANWGFIKRDPPQPASAV